MFTKCVKTFKCVCHSCFKEAQSVPDLKKQVKKSLCLTRRDASCPVWRNILCQFCPSSFIMMSSEPNMLYIVTWQF